MSDNKMQKQKICPVCSILQDDESLALEVDSLLKTTDKITAKTEPLISNLISSKNIKTPSYYYLNKHKDDCLKDFIPEVKLENLNTSESCELIDDTLNIDFDGFDSWDSIKKEIECAKLLDRIYYKKLLSIDKQVNIQKISDSSVSSLKTLKDLRNNVNVEHIKLDITDKDSIEKTGIDLIEKILEKQIINLDVALDIAKLLISKGGKLEFLKNISDITDVETLNMVAMLVKEKRKSISEQNEE